MADCSVIGWGSSAVCNSTSGGIGNILGPILILAGIALIYIAFIMHPKKEVVTNGTN